MSSNESLKNKISLPTLGHYEMNAEGFWEGTKDHDVSQNYAAMFEALEGEGPFTILDLGCGPGRDLLYFNQKGHTAIGIDGAEAFCTMAHSYSGCEVWQQDFLALDLPDETFDAIFANATLFHVFKREFPRVLSELYRSLRPGGILFSSNPRGPNIEEWYDNRYGHFFDYPTFQAYLQNADFEVLNHYYRPPGKPREEQSILAVVARKR